MSDCPAALQYARVERPADVPAAEPRTVDVHIRRLRVALNMDGHPDLIRTVRAAGYALDAQAS